MSRQVSSSRVRAIDSHVEHEGGVRESTGGVKLAVALLGLVTLASLIGLLAEMQPGNDAGAVGDGRGATSLLHQPGGPVDVVEQFIAAVNYGQGDVAIDALAPDLSVVQLPLQSTSRSGLQTTLGIFRDIRSTIQMFGCREDDTSLGSPRAHVTCSVYYASDFVRSLDSGYLRLTMDFLVTDGLIRRVLADLEPFQDFPTALQKSFDKWLFDFYTADLTPPSPVSS